MSKLDNVINFLCDNNYDQNTIIDDINMVISIIDSENIKTDFKRFDDLYRNLLFKRMEEANNFYKAVVESSGNIFYNFIKEHITMPFRNSRNPMAEKALFEGMLHVDNLRYREFVISLIGYVHPTLDNNLISLIDNALAYYEIDFHNIDCLPRFNTMHPFPKDDKTIIDNFNLVKDNKKDNNYGVYLGQYSELLAYQYLLEGLFDDEKIIWTSRDVGDGFGYDISIYNKESQFIDLYEVKGKYNSEREIELTDFENKIKEVAFNTDNTCYHILKVYINNNDITYIDIYEDEDGNIKAIDQHKNEYKVVEVFSEKKDNKLIRVYKP